MAYHTLLSPGEDAACDWAGCDEPARHPAPRGRDGNAGWLWFCLDHVREYNRGWDYCRGMTAGDIEAELRSDAVWRRPSRPAAPVRAAGPALDDPFDLLGGGPAPPPGSRWPPGGDEAAALGVLGLDENVTRAGVKTRYKELIKRHHPDANGGCPASEERLKSITRAYRILLRALAS